MTIDYDLWKRKHSICVEKILRACDLDKSKDAVKNAVKCNSTLCVIKNAMLDIQAYFDRNKKNSAELCFLIRNIDVIITGLLDINHILFGIGLRKQENAVARCFTDKDVINKFRNLRSLIHAHPVDTNFANDKGELEIVFLEDIRPYNPSTDGLLVKVNCDYVKRMCRPESHHSFFEPLSIEVDILPVISIIIDSLDRLICETDKKIASEEQALTSQHLNLSNDSIQEYILSLDKELERRYPSVVENVEYNDGTTRHYSIIYECLMFYNAHFKKETEAVYGQFLNYLEKELKRIEVDLQNMEFDEDKYFSLLYCSDFAPSLSYEKQKMEYLRESNEKSYTEKYIGNDISSNALWGIRCFRLLMPFIEQYIPVDTSVSDKELYCQYVAAGYLSTISA